MKRTLKFRCWVKDENRWGSNMSLDDILKDDEVFSDEELSNCDIMQFTGVLDENGKEIYEGDIIEYTVCGIRCKAWIIWNEYVGAWQFQYKGANDGNFNINFLHTILRNKRFPALIEVIGNIYETPTLLQK